jgi:type I restriction enzyme S subunit
MKWEKFKLSFLIEKPISGEWGDGEGSIRVIRSTNFTNDGTLNLSDVVLRDIQQSKVERKKLKKGDVIIEKSGGSPTQPVGRVVHFLEENQQYLCNNFTSVLRPKSNVNARYLFWCLFSGHINGSTLKFQNKTTGIINLQLERYCNEFEVPLPPLYIQQQIADTLDKADALRRKDKELLQKYDQLAQAIFYDMFGDPAKNGGDIERKKLGELTQINSGSTPSRDKSEYYGGTIPWVKTTEVKGKRIFKTEESLTEEGLKNSSCNIYEKGSIVLAMYGQGKTRGNVGLLEIAAATNQACAVIKPNENFISEFLYYQLKYSYDDLRSLGRGGTQPNLNVGIVKDFEVVIPHINEQIEFCKKQKVLNNLSDQSLVNEEKSDVLFNRLLMTHFS